MSVRSLCGKRVILTGATSGIGWSLAIGLIGSGAKLIVDGRRTERLERLRLTLGNCRHLICVPGDLCEAAHREELIETATAKFGGVDILINNAGVGAIGAFDEADPLRLRQLFELNFFAAVELTRLAIPKLKRGLAPAICNISSVLGYRGVPLKSEYCATKFALRGWSESLRVELKSSGIDVLTVSPSTTKSEFFQSLIGEKSIERQIKIGAQSADRVAKSTIRALQRGRPESILSAGGKALVWLGRGFPRLTDLMLQKFAMA